MANKRLHDFKGPTLGRPARDDDQRTGFGRDRGGSSRLLVGLMLGECSAEEIKMSIGSAFPLSEEPTAEIRGRDLVSGLPKTITVGAEEIRKAIEEQIHSIVDAVRTTLDQTPPELAGDIMDRGIVLTGGGAMLLGLDERIRHETGMPVHLANDPLTSVALGAGKCVEEFEALQQVLVSDHRR